jgi:hypothetical protein
LGEGWDVSFTDTPVALHPAIALSSKIKQGRSFITINWKL